jgi:hypothetical protein
MAKRPLVAATIRTEFGDVLDEPAFHDIAGSANDLTYVPGFSDMRRARDLELAAVASGQKPKHEAKLTPLPVNVRWTRSTTPKGAPDGRKQISTANLGYRTANKDQIGKTDWLTALPPGATIEADGSIRKGDTILMVTDGKTAARNAARKAVLTQRMSEDVGAAAGGLLTLNKPGTDAYVRKEA